MRKVRWNNKAKLDYFENIDFLLEKWTAREAQKFIDEVSHVEFILAQGNVDFQDTDILGVKRFVIKKQITLFYKIVDENNIEFLRFWNNNKDETQLKL